MTKGGFFVKIQKKRRGAQRKEAVYETNQGGMRLSDAHFMLKEDLGHDYAVSQVREEVARYKSGLEHNRTKYKITEETTQPDGSIVIRIIKQYNSNPVGDYLN